MLLRFPPPGRRRGLSAAACLLALGGLSSAACRPHAATTPAAPEVELGVRVAPDPPTAGPAVLTLTLTDRATGQPVGGARVRLQGTMAHPGMAPVAATASEVAPGRYEAPLELTMAGDWVLLVDAALRDGRALARQVDLPGVRPRPAEGRGG